MKKDLLIKLAVYLLCPLLIVIGGCSRTQTAKFYTLNALTDARAGGQAVRSDQGVAVGLGPFLISEKFFQKLPPAHQEVVQYAASISERVKPRISSAAGFA